MHPGINLLTITLGYVSRKRNSWPSCSVACPTTNILTLTPVVCSRNKHPDLDACCVSHNKHPDFTPVVCPRRAARAQHAGHCAGRPEARDGSEEKGQRHVPGDPQTAAEFLWPLQRAAGGAAQRHWLSLAAHVIAQNEVRPGGETTARATNGRGLEG